METTSSPPQNLTSAAEKYVKQYFRDHIDEKYFYHNFQHTCDVIEAARRLSTGYTLSAKDNEALILAAWFHDTGYDKGAEGHEARGQVNARKFLAAHGYPEAGIQRVEHLIEATQMRFQPRNLLEEIIRDSDYSHLGSELYWDRCSRVRQELLMTRRSFLNEEEWVENELDFITNHHYHTELARQYYDNGKFKNIKQLKKYQQRIIPSEESEEERKWKKQQKKAEKEIKELSLGRGVETMYRNTYRTHLNLSAIADNKANIMLSINAIIMSIVISSLIPSFNAHPELIPPTFLLLAVCLGALVFAILSTRPKVTKGESSREDIARKQTNLLFFGNFYNMKLEDFDWGIMEMIKDRNFLYSSMTRDIYYLGKVLAQKYRYLRICYGIFMYGLIAVVIAFGLVLWLN
jgi:predicted metal-dependent HD superfamily phosphohydrolase